MANTRSAKKAWRKSTRKALINKTRRSDMRTHLKKARQAVAMVTNGGDIAQAREALRIAESKMCRRVARRVIARKAASRRVSRLTQQLKKLEPAQ